MQNTAKQEKPQKTARCDHTSSVSKHNKVATTKRGRPEPKNLCFQYDFSN